MRPLGSWLAAVVLLVVAGDTVPTLGQQAARANGGAAPQAAALEREARQIEAMLIAPCCWREQVSVHQSEAAEQVKQEIHAMLAAGLTRQQVLDRFVSAYGARILAEPPDAGIGRVLHHAPWVLGFSSLIGLAFVIRRITRHATAGLAREDSRSAAFQAAAVSGDEAYGERLDDELRDLD